VFYEKSVYYYWFEYLRRNEDYKQHCEEKNGNKQIAKLYDDFGDIYSVDFRKWWKDVGQALFCEKEDLERIQIIKDRDALNLSSDDVLNIAVPLNKNIEWLERQYLKLIREKQRQLSIRKRGALNSNAKYSLATSNADADKLRLYLKVYDAQKEAEKNGEELSYVQLARKLGMYKKQDALLKTFDDLDYYDTYEIQKKFDASKRTQIYRYLRQATEIIKNTADGVFPQHSVRNKK